VGDARPFSDGEEGDIVLSAMAVDDTTVQRIIDEALEVETERLSGKESDVPALTRIVNGAFRSLQRRRQTLEPLNIDLAAAEHYMYARLLAGVTGDPLVSFAPTMYAIKKQLFFALGIEDWMATTRQPVLPPNKKVHEWGKKGAKDGLADYRDLHPGSGNQLGSSVKALRSEAYRTGGAGAK
jgi:hypothetical protein